MAGRGIPSDVERTQSTTEECSPSVSMDRRVIRSSSRANAPQEPVFDDDDDFEIPPCEQEPKGRGKGKGKAKAKGKGKLNDSDEETTGNYSVVRCSSGVIFEAIEMMPDVMKERLREIGFGGILGFKVERLSVRALRMYLMNCIEDNPLRLEVSGRSLLITPDVVELIFGIPKGSEPFPTYTSGERTEGRQQMRELCDSLGMAELLESMGKQGIKLGAYEVPRSVVDAFFPKMLTYL